MHEVRQRKVQPRVAEIEMAGRQRVRWDSRCPPTLPSETFNEVLRPAHGTLARTVDIPRLFVEEPGASIIDMFAISPWPRSSPEFPENAAHLSVEMTSRGSCSRCLTRQGGPTLKSRKCGRKSTWTKKTWITAQNEALREGPSKKLAVGSGMRGPKGWRASRRRRDKKGGRREENHREEDEETMMEEEEREVSPLAEEVRNAPRPSAQDRRKKKPRCEIRGLLTPCETLNQSLSQRIRLDCFPQPPPSPPLSNYLYLLAFPILAPSQKGSPAQSRRTFSRDLDKNALKTVHSSPITGSNFHFLSYYRLSDPSFMPST